MATNHCTRPKIRGFSLVEMAVVLAIVGLLVGGVLAGQSLLKGQRLRAVLTDATTYATAIQQFKLKYSYLPGDFPTASSVWGRMNGNADCVSTAGVAVDTTGGGACDGNGDGYILHAVGAGQSAESFQLWRQLFLAGFISQKLSGLNGPGNASYDAIPGVNSPTASLANTTYWFYGYWGAQTDNGTFYTGDYTNAMVFGTRVPSDWPYNGALTPKEAMEIDTKADDGKPAFGSLRMFGRTWSGALCVTQDIGSLANYNLASDNIECRILFMNTYMQSKEQLR